MSAENKNHFLDELGLSNVSSRNFSHSSIELRPRSLRPYPASSTQHASYTMAKTSNDNTEPSLPSTETQSFAYSNGGDLLPSNVVNALAYFQDQTGFIIIQGPSKIVHIMGPKVKVSPKVNSAEPSVVDGGEYSPNSASSIMVSDQDKAQFISLKLSETGSSGPGFASDTGFTPIIEQTRTFLRGVEVIDLIGDTDLAPIIKQTENLAKRHRTVLKGVKDVEVTDLTGDVGFALIHNPAATEFTLFPDLPAELQLLIWKHTLPGARVVNLNVSLIHPTNPPTLTAVPATLPPELPITSLPTILHANRDSRAIALKVLGQSFVGADITQPRSYTYFNPSLDTLRLTLPSAKHIAKIADETMKADRMLVRHVEIVFPIVYCHTMWYAMAELVLCSPHRSWPSIATWTFPGEPLAAPDPIWPNTTFSGWGNVVMKEVNVKHTASLQAVEDGGLRRKFAREVKRVFRNARSEVGTEAQIGVKFVYYDGEEKAMDKV